MNCPQCHKPILDLYAGERSDLVISYATEESAPLCASCATARVRKLWDAVLQSGIKAEEFLQVARMLMEMEE